MGNDVTGGFLYETSYAEGNTTHAEENAERMCGNIANPRFDISQTGKKSVAVYHWTGKEALRIFGNWVRCNVF